MPLQYVRPVRLSGTLRSDTSIVSVPHVIEDVAKRRALRDVYERARRVARKILRTDAASSWRTTELTQEAFRRLLTGVWAERLRDDPSSVVPLLSQVMTRALLDERRRAYSSKRPKGGGRERVPLESDTVLLDDDMEMWLRAIALVDTLKTGATELKVRDPVMFGRVLELALCGFTTREIESATGCPQRTVATWIKLGRAVINDSLNGSDDRAR